MAEVLVGVDGSEGSVKALRYAVEEARRQGWDVRAVHVWSMPLPDIATLGGFVLDVDREKLAEAHRRQLDEAVEAVGDTEGVRIERELREGQPAEQLIDAAGEENVLVLASRGLGGFAGLMLGSVTQECVRHARCPVIVVRSPET
jgi:nucleotide-binding universal stress UspA family protein